MGSRAPSPGVSPQLPVLPSITAKDLAVGVEGKPGEIGMSGVGGKEVANEMGVIGTAPCAKRRRFSKTQLRAPIAGVAIGIVLVVMLSGTLTGLIAPRAVPSVRGSCDGGTSGTPPVARTDPSYGAEQLTAAERSLGVEGEVGAAGTAPAVSGNGTGSGVDERGCSVSSGAFTPLATATPSWTQVTYPSPSARIAPSMVYDAKDGYVLLFGGYNSNGIYLGDTWKFSGGVWTNITPTTSPPARTHAGMAYDAKDGYVVLFGGYGVTGYLGDTWKFVGGVWTELTPSPNPGPRAEPSMAYDAKDGYVVLYGGVNASGLSPTVTWEFVGGKWKSVTLSPTPAARDFASMDYDAKDGYLVLFGGEGTSAALGDTWNYSGGKWTDLSPAASPSARYGAGLAYSAINSELVLFGGQSASGQRPLGDTWNFTKGDWTQVSSAAHPSNRYYMGVADGTSKDPIVVFGGTTATSYVGDTWTFKGLVWTHVLARQPQGRTEPAMAYDEADGYVLLFGGQSLEGTGVTLDDTWTFSNGVWTPLHPPVSPPARASSAMTYDQADGYVVLFGGFNAAAALSDTWTFSHGVWTNVTSAGDSPPARYSEALTYDYADGYVLMFGGEAQGGASLGDTWTYSAGVWTKLYPSTAPSARVGAEMTYDSEDGYVLLFSGIPSITKAIIPADTWIFQGGTWTNITSSLTASPPGTSVAGFVDDTYDGYPLMYGGITLTGTSATSWEYTGTGWAQLSPATNLGSAWDFGMAFDPQGNYVVAFSGSSTWTY